MVKILTRTWAILHGLMLSSLQQTLSVCSVRRAALGNLFMLLEPSTADGNSQIFTTVYMSMGLSALSSDWKICHIAGATLPVDVAAWVREMLAQRGWTVG